MKFRKFCILQSLHSLAMGLDSLKIKEQSSPVGLIRPKKIPEFPVSLLCLIFTSFPKYFYFYFIFILYKFLCLLFLFYFNIFNILKLHLISI